MADATSPTDALFSIATFALGVWSYTAVIWTVQILAARHGFHWNAWHIAGYLAVWSLCSRPLAAELSHARIDALWKHTKPDADNHQHIFPLYVGHALAMTALYAVVRGL